MQEIPQRLIVTFALLLGTVLVGCTNEGSVGADTNTGDEVKQTQQVKPVVSTRGRIMPVQGADAISDPPLRQPEPAKHKADYVSRDTGKSVTRFPNLGEFKIGPPSPRVIRNELVAGDNIKKPSNPARVYWMLHMSDTHATDMESPGLIPASKFAFPAVTAAAYRPQFPYQTHLVNAQIKAANQIAQETAGFNLAIHTGDAIENGQKNELKWFLTLMNGGIVQPDSGNRNEIVPGPHNDPQDQFAAPGLDAPWITTIGNHDILALGNLPPPVIRYANDRLRFEFLQNAFGALGLAIPNVPIGYRRRAQLTLLELDLKTDKGLTGLDAPITLEALLSREDLNQAFEAYFNNGNLMPERIAPDRQRKAIDRCGLISAYLHASGKPRGHGFTAGFNSPVGQGHCSGNYAYTPPNAPWLRVVSLGTAYPFGGDMGVVGHAQNSPDMQALKFNGGIDPATSRRFSTPKGSQPLKYPGTGEYLFSVPGFQGLPAPKHNGDPQWDSIAFLDQQLQKAVNRQQLVIVVSHHASGALATRHHLRVFLEESICSALKEAAVLVSIDCDASDGTLSTGDVGAPVRGRHAKGNVQALNFFARLINQKQNAKYGELTQADINAAKKLFNSIKRGGFRQVVKAFNTLFALRALMPDPAGALSPAAFRQKLANNPNVIMHLAGHEHQMRIAAVCGNGHMIPAGSNDSCESAGTGYYEIVTSGPVQVPTESRMLEIVDNNNGTVTVYTTTFSAIGGEFNNAGISLSMAEALTSSIDLTLGGGVHNHQDRPGDVNTKLTIPIPRAIDQRLDQAATRSRTVLSLSEPILRPSSKGRPNT